MGLMTKLYMLDTSEVILFRGEDFALVLFILLTPIAYKRNKSAFSWKQDKIARWIYIFIFFYILELIITVVSGTETLVNSIKVVRYSLLIFSFFIFRSIPLKEYVKFIKVVFPITVFQSLLYLLQLFGIRLLAGGEGIDSSLSDMGFITAYNIPTFTLFFLFLSFNTISKKKNNYIIFLYLTLIVLLTFARGLIISIFIGIFYIIVRKAKRKHIFPVIIGTIISIFVVSFFLDKKTEGSREDSHSTQLTQILKNKNNIEDIAYDSGTMVFRLAMLIERVNYLFENPQYLLTGVGTMHEDSPRTFWQFNFAIGTVNEGRDKGYCLIESGDITWVPIVLRYGLLGVSLHLYILFLMILESKSRRDDLFVLAPLYISILICSFDSSLFENTEKLYLMTLFFSILSRARMEKNCLNYNS
jgi:hypothetical protein